MGDQTVTATNAAPAATGTHTDGHPAGGPATEALNRLRFELLRSALYHDICQLRAARTHRSLTFLNVLLSSGAIAAFGAQIPLLGQLAGVAVASISAIQFVWAFGGSAHCHGALRRRFYDLLAEVEEGADRAAVEGRQTRIFADEPPMSHAVNRIAHNRAGMAIYGDDYIKV